MASYFKRNIIVFILLSVFLREIVATKIQPLSKDKSLIYVENDRTFYCRFATEAELQDSKGLASNDCHVKFKEIAQILPDGNVTKPFLKSWSKKGYDPACKKLNIPNGILGECNPGWKIPLVHTVCTYRCAPGFIATSNNVTCSLMGPQNNVTFQWLKDSDFFDPENMESEYCKQLTIPNGKLGVCSMDSKRTQLHCNYCCDPDCIATNASGNFHFDIKNYSSFQSSNVKELCIRRDPTVEQFSDKRGTLTVLVAVSVSVAVGIIIIAFMIIAVQSTRRKRKLECTVKVPIESESEAQEEPPNENDPLLQDTVPVLPDDTRLTITPTDDRGTDTVAFGELPDGYGSDSLRYLANNEIQRINQDRDDPKKVGHKDMPETDPDFQSIMQQFLEPLNDDLTLQESQEKFSGYACGAELKAGLSSCGTAGSLSSLDLESFISKKEENCVCSTNVRYLLEKTSNIYHLKLFGELEVIDGRRRDQALVGYVLKNMKALGFPSENSIKVHEETFKNKVDEKVSEYFLRYMSNHGHTIGMMLEYFAHVDASNVIEVVLEVHKGCPFCEKFRK